MATQVVFYVAEVVKYIESCRRGVLLVYIFGYYVSQVVELLAYITVAILKLCYAVGTVGFLLFCQALYVGKNSILFILEMPCRFVVVVVVELV